MLNRITFDTMLDLAEAISAASVSVKAQEEAMGSDMNVEQAALYMAQHMLLAAHERKRVQDEIDSRT